MRLPLNRILRKITRYRFRIQHYPGRWTTLVVIVVYMALAVFLALMNSEILIFPSSPTRIC
ncbi:hypothetical protein BDZ89DRAFT_1078930 [Hymenopellis radicata]|nr:hypothetical protein BDZ89DRAFT_1078930 [Hymenopellis radicata]